MCFYGATEYFEFDSALGVHGQNSRHCGIGILCADHHVTTGDRHESRAGVGQASPEPTVGRHVHEIDSEVSDHRAHKPDSTGPGPAQAFR